MSWLKRTELLVGDEKLQKLKNSNIIILGLGGVGAYAAEQICRAGVNNLTIIDGDKIQKSNLNRQLLALHSNENLPKVDVMAQRLYDINPDLNLNVINEYIKDNRTEEVLLAQKYDYVVDAIDTLSPKVNLIVKALENNLNLVSSMGTGGKLDPSQVQIADISKSYNDMLARMLRKGLHKLGIYKGFKVVFSPESVDKSKVFTVEGEQNKKSVVGTISYMPAVFGNFIASVVISSILSD